VTALPNQEKADFIFHNGKVLTVDANDSVQQAVAISGKTIDVVGSDLDVIALAGANTTLVNLQGHTLIPGIIDIHAHMDREGLKRLNPSLEGTRSIADILAVVKEEVANKRAGEWVVTMPVGDPPNYADVPGNLRHSVMLCLAGKRWAEPGIKQQVLFPAQRDRAQDPAHWNEPFQIRSGLQG